MTQVTAPPDQPEGGSSPPRRHRRRWPWLLLLVLLVPAGAAAWLLWPRSPTPISENQAVEGFRTETTGAAPTGAGMPAAGVYTYDVDGHEDISMGPVPLPTRDIPSTVTMVVVPDGDCYRLDLNLMAEHTEQTTYCIDGPGTLRLVGQTKVELVPGFRVDGRTTCAQAVLVRPGETEQPVTCSMTLDVGGITLNIALAGRATLGPADPVTVGGTALPARLLTLDLTATGDERGHWIERQWLAQDSFLPLRVERDIVLEGTGSFKERSTLQLTATIPRT